MQNLTKHSKKISGPLANINTRAANNFSKTNKAKKYTKKIEDLKTKLNQKKHNK